MSPHRNLAILSFDDVEVLDRSAHAESVASATHTLGLRRLPDGKGNEYNHRVSRAFFVESKDIGNIEVLTKLASEVGLNEKVFEEALRTSKHREDYQ